MGLVDHLLVVWPPFLPPFLERASLSRVNASRETSGLTCPKMPPVIATLA